MIWCIKSGPFYWGGDDKAFWSSYQVDAWRFPTLALARAARGNVLHVPSRAPVIVRLTTKERD